MYDVNAIYTIDGQDRWECTAFWRDAIGHKPPNRALLGPNHYTFQNLATKETLSGTQEQLPNFQEVGHVKAA